MRIVDYLNEKAVSPSLQATHKEGVIRELVELLVKSGAIKEKEKLVKTLMARETLGSTGIGQGIGIPHGKSDSVKQLVCALGISHKGVDFDSLDGELTSIFFLLVAPEDSAGPHLKALARISRLLKDKYLREQLCAIKEAKAVLKLIAQEEEKLGP